MSDKTGTSGANSHIREMSVTERLRALLDERGVEYFKHEDGEPLRELHEGRDDATSWKVGGANVCAVPFDDYTFDLWIDHATPEQAVAATLGRGTCHIGRGTSGLMHVTTGHCSECGAEVVKPARYCPNCGRRVE